MKKSQLHAISYAYSAKRKRAAQEEAERLCVGLLYDYQTTYKTLNGFLNGAKNGNKKLLKELEKNISSRLAQLTASRCTSYTMTSAQQAQEQLNALKGAHKSF